MMGSASNLPPFSARQLVTLAPSPAVRFLPAAAILIQRALQKAAPLQLLLELQGRLQEPGLPRFDSLLAPQPGPAPPAEGLLSALLEGGALAGRDRAFEAFRRGYPHNQAGRGLTAV
jgi:hypothetical protein